MAKHHIVTGLKVLGVSAGLVFLATPKGSNHFALFVVSLSIALVCLAMIYVLHE